MKMSACKSYDDLPLFLNAKLVAQVLGVSISTAYEVMHEPSFPTLRVGSRMVVPKESLFSGRRNSLEVRNEKAELDQAGSHQKLFPAT